MLELEVFRWELVFIDKHEMSRQFMKLHIHLPRSLVVHNTTNYRNNANLKCYATFSGYVIL